MLSVSVLWAGDANFQKLFDKVNPHLVSVEYKAEMNFMGQSEDIEGRVPGIIINGNIVIFDGTSLGAGRLATDMYGSPQVDKPKSIKITDYNDNTYDAEYIGVDDYSLIAFCRLPDSAMKNLKAVELKNKSLRLGEEVYVFWMLPKSYNPKYQLTKTRITSVLTKPEKFYLTGELPQEFVLSPVVTAKGEMIGIITPVTQVPSYTRFDYGNVFGNPVGIMPLERFEKIINNPPEEDKVKRGWMGISLQALDPEIAEFWDVKVDGGIILTDIIDNSPAEKAGLKAGDFLIKLNGESIDVTEDENISIFQKKVSELGAGSEITLLYIRPGDNQVDSNEVTIVLAERPGARSDAPKHEDENFDLTVRDMVFADYNARNLKEDEISGVIVEKIEQGGWAAVGGLRTGLIITQINGNEIVSVEDFKTIMAEIESSKDKEVVFMTWRRNKTKFVHVKTHWE